MTAEQLIQRVRNKVMDNSGMQFWTDDEILFNINEAQKEAAVRKNLIFDKSSQIVTLSTEVGVQSYALNPLIYRIRGVRADSKMLTETTVDMIDYHYPDGYPEGVVTKWYMDEDDRLYLYRIPQSIQTITVEAFRMPVPMVDLTDECELPSMYQDQMLAWAYKLCYEKLDAEVNRPELASFFEVEFAKVFGPLKTASQWKQHRRSTTNTVRMHRF